MAKSKGLTVGISADLKEFKKGLTDVNKEINKTAKQAEAFKKELNFKYDANNFIEAQKNAQKAIEKTSEKAQALKQKIKELEQNGGQGTKDWEYLTNELAKTNLKAQQLKRSLEDINKIKADNLKNTLTNAGNSLQKVGQALAPISAIAGAGLFGLYKVSKGAIETADKMQTLADRVGVSVEKLQEYNYIAKQTDIEQAEFVNILKKTNGALASLSTGKLDQQAKALEALGITSEQAKKGLDENFDLIFESLSSIQDPMQQLALLNDLLGEKLGQSLVPMLKLGSQNVNELKKEFRAFGVVSGENAKKLSDFDNVINNLKEKINILKVNLGTALLPVMEQIAQVLNEKIFPTISKIIDYFDTLSDRTKTMITLGLGITSALAPVLLVGGQLIKTLAGLVQGFKLLQVAMVAIQAHPIVLAVAGVIALLTILIVKNEKLREQFKSILKTLGDAFLPLFQAFQPILDILTNTINIVAKTLGDTLVPIFEILNKVLKSSITLQLQPLILSLKMTGIMLKFLEKPLQAIASVVDAVLVPAFNGLNAVFEAIMFIFNELVALFFDGVSGVVNFIIDMINGVIKTLNAVDFLDVFKDIKELNKVDITHSLGLREPKIEKSENLPDKKKENIDPIKNSNKIIEKATETNNTQTTIYNYNNDNSTKSPTINITVENYGEQVDIEELTKKINIELAKAM